MEIVIIAALLVAFVVETILTESENFGWATIVLLICAGVCYYFNIYDVAVWLKANTLKAFLFIWIYFVFGAAWSFAKWFSFLVNYRDKWREAREKDRKKLPPLIESARKDIERYNKDNENNSKNNPHYEYVPENIPTNDYEWLAYFSKHSYKPGYRLNSSEFAKPLASDNKAKIIAWMSFWPFSLLGTLINDPVRRLFSFLFMKFKVAYQIISDKVFEDFK